MSTLAGGQRDAKQFGDEISAAESFHWKGAADDGTLLMMHTDCLDNSVDAATLEMHMPIYNHRRLENQANNEVQNTEDFIVPEKCSDKWPTSRESFLANVMLKLK